METTRLVIPEREIKAFCERWHIIKLEIFGSAARDDFNETSDIDLLVEFDSSYHRTLSDQIKIQTEIEEIFRRSVDLIVRKTIQNSPNPYKRNSILSSAKEIYVKG